jgi:hypothetical protein
MKKLIVAKQGVNALTATDPNDFIFHSDYNTFKILKEGSASPALPDSAGIEVDYSFTLGLDFTPLVFGFCKFANGRVGPPGSKASNVDFWFTVVRTEDDGVIFRYINNTGGNYTPTFKYIAFEVPA